MVTVEAVTRNQEDNGYRFVISDETPDNHGTVFRIDGWQNGDNFQSPVTYGHPSMSDPDPDNASIALSDVKREGNMLVAYIPDNRWDEGDPTNPNVGKVKRKIENGTLKAASIRAAVSSGHWGDKTLGEDPDIFYFTEHRLLDWGIVPHGSNPNAYKRGADTLITEERKKLETLNTVTIEDLKLKKTKWKNQ